MSKVVRVQDGDYKIVVGSSTASGNIVLDTNPVGILGAQGNVIITGDLTVLGNTTVVQSETLSIKDNIIVINQGEQGQGVVSQGSTSGIEIDRGTEPNVSILWDELLESRYPRVGIDLTGTFKFIDNNEDLVPIATNSINTFGENLALISTGSGIVTVTGTADYEERILDYSKLNVVFQIVSIGRLNNVTTLVTNTAHNLLNGDKINVVCFTDTSFNENAVSVTVLNETSITYQNIGSNVSTLIFSLSSGGTIRPYAVIDDDHIPNMKAVVDYNKATLLDFASDKIQKNDTGIQVYDFNTFGLSKISFVVDSIQQVEINNTGLYVNNINIFENNISNYLNDNIKVDSVLSLKNKATTPVADNEYVTIYSKSEIGTGGTGIYFVNSTGIDDELISKTKALLYSLIL